MVTEFQGGKGEKRMYAKQEMTTEGPNDQGKLGGFEKVLGQGIS